MENLEKPYKVNEDRSYGYVYITHCSATNKWYIGSHKWDTTNPPDPLIYGSCTPYNETHNHHMFTIDPNYVGSGSALWEDIKKYGWSSVYVYDILDIAANDKDLRRLEKEYIEWYKSHGWNLYNIRTDGSGGDMISSLPPDKYEELCRKQRAKRFSEESKARLRMIRKNNPKYRPPSQEGNIRINNGSVEKVIKPEELPEYEKLGFTRGRLHGNKKMGSHKGMIKITDGTVNKIINPEELQEYESKGFWRGDTRLNSVKGKIMVNNGEVNKWINPEDLDLYLSKGYLKGKYNSTTEGQVKFKRRDNND